VLPRYTSLAVNEEIIAFAQIEGTILTLAGGVRFVRDGSAAERRVTPLMLP
jgi:hypothetical protein